MELQHDAAGAGPPDSSALAERLASIAAASGAEAYAAAFYDYQSAAGWEHAGATWFHAASTINVAVLAAVFARIEDGRCGLHSRLHVRNRFLSAVDGEPYRVSAADDGNASVHAAIGRTMTIEQLARQMIVTSSNLATNLLLDLVGVDRAR